LRMGKCAANNISKMIIKQVNPAAPSLGGNTLEETFELFPEVPPMMALSVGHCAVSFTPKSGVTFGEEVMAAVFDDDLGLKGCWNDMRLGAPR